MKILHIQLLGDFSLTYGDAPVLTVSSPRLQSLLAYLVLHYNAPQSRSQLSFLFWPDSNETQARTNLRKLIYELRHALPEADDFIDLDGPTLQWREEYPFTFDVADFERLVDQAETSGDLQDAVRLYKGDFLPNCYEDWALLERQRLHGIFIEALDRLIGLLENDREYSTAIEYTHLLLEFEPLREDAYRQLMRLYAVQGDRAGVLRTYQSCLTVLQRELEIEPGPLTQQAYERLLNLKELPPPLPSRVSRWVGRNAEWAQLQTAWKNALEGQMRWIMLTGEEGIGKTRLAEELLQWVGRQGFATASAQCYATGTKLAYTPVTALLRSHPLPVLNKLWLTEISRLLPEILADHPNLSPPDSLNEPWQRHRFFEALARAILAHQPLMLLIDDLQWCDRETLEWLNYLLHFDSKARLLIVSTACLEDLVTGLPLASLLPDLRREEKLTEINIGPLTPSDTLQLVNEAAGTNLEVTTASNLHEITGGNPFSILELLRSGLLEEPHSEPVPSPQAIQSAINAHLAQLSPAARELTGLAATFGREFTLDILARANEFEDDDLVYGIAELWQRQIVREHEKDAYNFSHSRLGEAVYAGLKPERRKQLHQKVAEALEAYDGPDLDLIAGEIASHFEQAGLPDRAIPYYIKAGDAARRIYANEGAINNYQRALTLLPEQKQVDVLLKLGEVWQLVGHWTEAEALFKRAQGLAIQLEDLPAQAHGLAAQGGVLYLRGDYRQALECLKNARSIFEQSGDLAGVCSVLESMGNLYYWQLEYEAALHCHQELLQIATRIRDQLAVGKANGSIGLVYRQQGDYESARQSFEKQLQIASENEDLATSSSALGRLGLVHCAQGKYLQAMAYFEKELKIADEIGYLLGVGHAKGNMARIYLSQEDYAQALALYIEQFTVVYTLGDKGEMSSVIRNIGTIYSKRGEYERATSCFARSLQIALELGSRRAIGQAIGSIAIVNMLQGQAEQADLLFKEVRQIITEQTLPYPLCSYLVHNAMLYEQQGRLEEARSINKEAELVAGRIKREDVLFKTRLMAIKIGLLLGESDVQAGIERLKACLEGSTDDWERAAVYYELWQLHASRKLEGEMIVAYRKQAADLYSRLYRLTYKAEYRQRYTELTGETPADPPLLPELPEIISQQEDKLDMLLEKVDQMVNENPESGSAVQPPYMGEAPEADHIAAQA